MNADVAEIQRIKSSFTKEQNASHAATARQVEAYFLRVRLDSEFQGVAFNDPIASLKRFGFNTSGWNPKNAIPLASGIREYISEIRGTGDVSDCKRCIIETFLIIVIVLAELVYIALFEVAVIEAILMALSWWVFLLTAVIMAVIVGLLAFAAATFLCKVSKRCT